MIVTDELYSGYDTFSDSLQHYGILGMKWGKRNGPPYPLTGKTMSASEKKAVDPSYAKAHDKKNKVKYMSDQDLKDVNNRLNLEKQYNSLRDSEVSEGKKALQKALKVSSTAVAITGMVIALNKNAGVLTELGKNGLTTFNAMLKMGKYKWVL